MSYCGPNCYENCGPVRGLFLTTSAWAIGSRNRRCACRGANYIGPCTCGPCLRDRQLGSRRSRLLTAIKRKPNTILRGNLAAAFLGPHPVQSIPEEETNDISHQNASQTELWIDTASDKRQQDCWDTV